MQMHRGPQQHKRGYLLGALSLFTILTTSCGPVHQTVQLKPNDVAAINTLAVTIPNEGSFTVYLDRTTATTAPAALFGLIGAAVAAGHNSALDNSKANALAPYLSGFSAKAVLLKSFRNTLMETGRFNGAQIFDRPLGENEGGKYDAILTLDIKEWGLRMPSQSEERLAGFIEVEAKMLRAKDGEKVWEEHNTVLGQRRNYFSEYKDDAKMFQGEIEETIKSAGARAAMQIAYPRGRNN